MSGSSPRRLLRRVLLAVVLLAVAATGLYWLELATPKREYFLERRGALENAELLQVHEDGVVQKTVRLESSSGLEVTLRLAPKSGIRINRYPKIKLTVPEASGLVGEAEAAIGKPLRCQNG